MNRPAEASTPSAVEHARSTPIKVDAPDPAGTRHPLVVAVVVTWNRKEMVDRALRALADQDYPRDRLHVVVVDNASTDGAVEHLDRGWRPEQIVENPTEAAHEPRFQVPTGFAHPQNTAGFASLTIVHNGHNLGGCGGFNTGFRYVERLARAGLPVDFVWLVDDDAEVPPDALAELTRAAATDERIGIVGSRTVDITDRETTIESTIYFDFGRGRFGDEPTPDHRLRASHDAWIAEVGGAKGRRDLRGLRDVDVVSACSLLARWSAVEKIGYWDTRYFIYCDDADWCLRFGRAGYRVVCNLDAVVYHTPWNLKLTPARLYYAQRNIVWTMRKLLPTWRLRYATFRWLLAILRQSVRASLHRRPFHARVLRRTARDIVDGRGGRLDLADPETIDQLDALRSADAVGSDRTILAICPGPRALRRVEECRAALTNGLIADGRAADQPRWVYLTRHDLDAITGAERHAYAKSLRSKLRRQVPLLGHPPRVVVIADSVCDLPVWVGRATVNLQPGGGAQVLHDPLASRLAHVGGCVADLGRAAWHALTVKPDDA